MAIKDFHPQDFVFIGYHDEAMTQEAGRLYPATEEDYYDCMEQAGDHFEFWQCALRSSEIASL